MVSIIVKTTTIPSTCCPLPKQIPVLQHQGRENERESAGESSSIFAYLSKIRVRDTWQVDMRRPNCGRITSSYLRLLPPHVHLIWDIGICPRKGQGTFVEQRKGDFLFPLR